MKRFIAVLICAFMLVSLFPAAAFATDGGEPYVEGGEGDGSGAGGPAEYEVFVTSNGNGTAYANPTSGVTGTSVTLTAVPADGYKLDKWEGNVTITGNTFTIGTENVEVKAIFVEDSSNNGGTDDGNNEVVDPEPKDNIQPQGKPEDGIQPAGDPVEPTDPVEYTITVRPNNASMGSVTDGVIICKEGDSVTVKATANEGYKFVGWKEGGKFIDSATTLTYTFTVTKDRNLIAAFVEADVEVGKHRITAEASPLTGGTVTGADDYEENATVTLTATASEGYKFVGWKEGGKFIDEATSSTYEFTATKSRKIVAAFVEADVEAGKHRITAEASPVTGGTVTGADDYEENATVTLTATASEGYKFVGWKEGGKFIDEATSSTYEFTATKSRKIVAEFEEITEPEPDPEPEKTKTNTTVKVSCARFTLGTTISIRPIVKDANKKAVTSGAVNIYVNDNLVSTNAWKGNSLELRIRATTANGFDVGKNEIRAEYVGDNTYESSKSDIVEVKVTKASAHSHYCCGQNHYSGKCVTVRPGEDVTFKVELARNEYCQWYVDRGDGCGFVKIKGATCPNYTVNDVTYKQDGYRYRCVVKNPCGTVRNPVFTLNVASGSLYFPKTGDNSNIVLCVGLVGLAACLLVRRRRVD